jgi:iron complex outermembrane receptor protein
VRYDHYSGEIGGAVNPRGALIITPPSRTAVKLLFGTAFRAPNAYERFYAWGDPTIGDAQLVNPDLAPERIQTYEAVVEQYAGEHVRAVLSGYYYRIDDLIRLETADALNNLSFQNVAEVDALGLEAAVEARGFHNILARASYALQRARDRTTDEVLVNSPHHLLKVLLSVPLWRDKLFVSSVVRYMTSRRLADGSDLRGHVVADLTVLSRELPRGLGISVSVKNLFDARTFDPGSAEHVQRGIQQNGRTFFVQATYRPDFRR